MGYRSYDPATGQFVSNDPAGLAGGDINLRTYVGNQPTDFIDPSGLKQHKKKPSGGQSSGKKKPPPAPAICVPCVFKNLANAAGNQLKQAAGNVAAGWNSAANWAGNAWNSGANWISNAVGNAFSNAFSNLQNLEQQYNNLQQQNNKARIGDPPAPPAPAAAERNASFPRKHQAHQLRPLPADRRRSSFQRTPTTSPAPPASAPPASSPPTRRSPIRSTSRTCRRPPRLRRLSPSHSSSVPTSTGAPSSSVQSISAAPS